MSDAAGPLTPPRRELIDFHGDQLIAVVLEGDGVAIPLRLLCERIGLDTDAQAEKLRTHAVLASGLRAAADLGCQRAVLNTQADNLRAQALYRSLGFHPTGERFEVYTRLATTA